MLKAKKNQDDIDGELRPLFNSETNKRIVFVTQNKFQYEESQKKTLEPADLLLYYEKAIRTPFTDSDTFVIIFTNKAISKRTQDMIIKGQITKTKKGDGNSNERITVDTSFR